MESVQCPSCHRSFADATLLSLHHEYEPCHESGNPLAAFDNLSCPICDKIFYDPLVLQIHVNEEHDQPRAHTTSDSLYAQELARRDRMRSEYEQHQQESASAFAYEDWPDDDDAQIARMLQEEENAQSCQEFQTHHGGSTRTFSERARWNLDKIFGKKMISQQKYNEYREKLDEMIAQPVERKESRSPGLIPMLSRLSMGNLLDRRLCRPGCDHMSSTWLDQGWACGYKNFQMLLSSLRQDPQYATHLFGANVDNQDIPSVSRLQALIERAWEAGFDSAGRAQLNRQLVNSTKWIGPTEVMACLAHLNIKTELFDFYQPKTIDKNVAYKYLFEWVRNYFRQQTDGNNIVHPLYLQHEGHSRTIIGYEQFRNGNIRLLMFDPGTPKPQIDEFRADPNDKAHIFRRSLQSFQKPVYQILLVRGLLRPEEREAAKRVRSSTVPMPKP